MGGGRPFLLGGHSILIGFWAVIFILVVFTVTPSKITMETFFSNRYSFFNFTVKFELSSHYNKQEEQYKNYNV